MKHLFLTKFIIVSLVVGVFSPRIDIAFTNGKAQVDIEILHKAEAKQKRSKPKPPSSRPPQHKPKPKPPHHKPKPPHYKHSDRYYYAPYPPKHHKHYGYYHGREIFAFSVGLAIGSIIASSTMPTTCTSVMVHGVTYRRCGNTYYKPFYHGNTLVYEVVRAPY